MEIGNLTEIDVKEKNNSRGLDGKIVSFLVTRNIGIIIVLMVMVGRKGRRSRQQALHNSVSSLILCLVK